MHARILWLIPDDSTRPLVLLIVPVLVGALLLIAFASPLLEAAASVLRIEFRERYGFPDLIYAFEAAVFFIGPLQYLGRDWSWTWRSIAIVLASGLPLAMVLFSRFMSPLDAPVLFALAVALIAIVLLTTEASRIALEFAKGLRGRSLVSSGGKISAGKPLVIGWSPLAPRAAPHRDNEARKVGVAMSGGGYRASLFALGAMMYVHEVCNSTSAPPRRVAAMTSVSGGSITNGIIAHGVNIGKDDIETFDRVAQILVRDTVTGGMFDWRTVAYYFCFVTIVFACAAATVIGLRTSWAFHWRAMFIVGFVVAVLLGGVFAEAKAKPKLISRTVAITALLLFFTYVVLSETEWRLGLALVDAALLVIISPVVVWAVRGLLIQRHYDHLLRQACTGHAAAVRLADIRSETDHIFCATEVQFGQTAYLSQNAIRCSFFKDATPDALPTALAVRASAAFPGVFPPVVVPGIEANVRRGVEDRTAKQSLSTTHLLLVDGGVRDNLAVSWFELSPPMDEYVIVSAAPNRHAYRRIPPLPGFAEFIALMNASFIPYNTRERNQRLAIAARLFGAQGKGDASARGALIHIEDSPTDLARKFIFKEDGAREADAWLRGGEQPFPDWDIDQWLIVDQMCAVAGAAVFSERAKNLLAHLEKIENGLPVPPEFSVEELYRVRFDSHASARQLGANPHFSTDVDAAWWMRARASSLIGTSLNRMQYKEAFNLVLHGYYLAMANLHVCAGWPLMEARNPDRLNALFAEVAPPLSPISDAERANLLRAQMQGLSPNYPLAHFFALEATVRQKGRFRRKAVISALAINERGSAELLGIWIFDRPRLGFGTASEIEAVALVTQPFWQTIVSDLRTRGMERVAACAADLSFGTGNLALLGCSETIAAAYPATVIYPRLSALTAVSTFFKTAEIEADLTKVLLEGSADAARERFTTVSARWGDPNRAPREKLDGAWNLIVPFFSFSVETRRMLLAVEAAIHNLERALESAASDRGPVSEDEIALIRVRQDLNKQGRLLKKVVLPLAAIKQLEAEAERSAMRGRSNLS
jgi:hypothetical protein